ncbi:oligosaccharide flippase family protein [Roseibium marinum]|uniref:O-antigen/teichoic acid export membrane protein n=1 Tax=Roseibium marinum TaxID=281252 RepID=A0A2S3USB6_9HYPH|nr:oligosaccharide flippase family protein [Roseibium marinum]POF30615.1 O-antigen/teichoic acid export membrane protein [Roseibium marinum]
MRFSAFWEKPFQSTALSQALGRAANAAGLLRGDGTDQGTAGRMAVSTFAIRVGGAALAYLSQIVLARLLGAHDYGIYSVAWTFLIVIGAMTCGGFSTSVSRFIPQYLQKGDMDGLRGFLRVSRQTAFFLGTLAGVLGIGLVFVFRTAIDADYVLPLIVVLFALPFFTFGQVQDGIARSYDWPSLAMVPTYIWRPLAILLLLVLAVLAGWRADALTATFAVVSATIVIALYQYVHLKGRLAPRVPSGPRRVDLRYWLAISAPMLLVDGFLQLITSADVIMISFFQDPDKVAVYFAASKTLALVHFVYFAVRSASAHRFSGYLHNEDQAGLAAYVRKATHWTFWPSLAAGAGLLLIAPLLLRLFGGGFESGYPLIALLMIGVLARASVGPADALLTMTGHQKSCAVIYAATFLMNVVFNLALIPLLGLAGAAIATSCAIFFEATALALTAKRKLQITTFIVPLLFASRERPVDQ